MQGSRSTSEEETATTHLAATGNLEELDYRESDGIAVSLLWQQNGNRLSVVVEDTKFGTNFTIPARPDNALDVFRRLLAHVA